MDVNNERVAQLLEEIGERMTALSVCFRGAADGGGSGSVNGKAAKAVRSKAKPAAKAGAATEPEITEDTLRASLKELAAAKGADAMAAALAEVGAGRLPEVEESDYEALAAKIKELMEAEDDADEAPGLPAAKGKAKPAAKGKAKKEPVPTLDELTEQFTKLIDQDRAAAKKILKNASLAKLSEIDEDDEDAMREMGKTIADALGDDDDEALV